MRILVTGKNGQLGNCLADKLKGMGDIHFLAVDRNTLDITNAEQVNSVVSNFKPTVIINAAAYTAVDKAEENIELAINVNTNGPKYLAEAAEKFNAVLIHLSTDYVFDGSKQGLYDEGDLTAPLNIYGKTKLAGELAIESNCEKYIIIRTSWVFGERGNNFVKTMLSLGAKKDVLNIVKDQYGGPTYAGDIVDAVIKIIKTIQLKTDIQWGVYHYSGSPIVSWFNFAQLIFEQAVELKIIDKQVLLKPVETSDFITLARRPKNSGLNCNKIRKNFDINQSDWRKALKRIGAYNEGIKK